MDTSHSHGGPLRGAFKAILAFSRQFVCLSLLALPTEGKDIVVFRFIIEYSSLRVFGAYVVGLFLIWGFLKDDSLACVETWD